MAGRSEVSVSGYRRPLGYVNILNAALQASVGIALPAAPSGSLPGYAVIQCQGGSVRWRDDGVAPTSSVGMTLASGQELDYSGDLSMIRFISSATTPILDISIYE